WADGIADPRAVARELVRRATERGVEVREHEDASRLDGDVFVIAAGPWSGEVGRALGLELPIRPLCRQLLATAASAGLPPGLRRRSSASSRAPTSRPTGSSASTAMPSFLKSSSSESHAGGAFRLPMRALLTVTLTRGWRVVQAPPRVGKYARVPSRAATRTGG